MKKYVISALKELKRDVAREQKYVTKVTQEVSELVDDLLTNGFSKRKARKILTRLERLDMCQDTGECIYYSDEPFEDEEG